MKSELENRVELLEEEVRVLRAELMALKQPPPVVPKKQMLPRIFTIENIDSASAKVPSTTKESSQTNNEKLNTIQKGKPKRSMEETITKALPKVFMVILVLGVLWGLKLVSDYGYLSDAIKIVLAFGLSIGLILAAFILEKKNRSTSAVTISLYGGAFIVGILATAAGAILYDVLNLIIALMIALCYIAYGIAISYLKENEILTSFVVFTSLLLPYLLEYMDFNSVVIVAFIIVLFASMQFVILKHIQKIAFYSAAFFSVLSTFIVWVLQYDQHTLFVIGQIVMTIIFLFSWSRLYRHSDKFKVIHEGLLFGASGCILFNLNIMLFRESFAELYLLLLLGVFVLSSIYMYKAKLSRAFDIVTSFALLILLNIFLVLNIDSSYQMLIMATSAFVGIMLGIRLQAPLMKVIYSTLFGLIALINYTIEDVTPFWQMGHFTLVILLIYMVTAYLYAKHPKKQQTRFEKWMEQFYLIDSVAVVIVLFFVLYIIKMDFAYISTGGDIPYMLFMIIPIATIGSFLVEKKWFSIAIPAMLTLFYSMSVFVLLLSSIVTSDYSSLDILARIISLTVLVALLIDLYMEGRICKKWASVMKGRIETILCAGFVIVLLQIMGMNATLNNSNIISTGVAVTANTLMIFIISSLALLVGREKQWRKMKYTGFGLLMFAILKLFFFDLAALDLLVRAILFIVVGGAGLLLSSRLLKK